MNETFDAVFDTEGAEEDEDALVNSVYDEIGLEFSNTVKRFTLYVHRISNTNILYRLKLLRQDPSLLERIKQQSLMMT